MNKNILLIASSCLLISCATLASIPKTHTTALFENNLALAFEDFPITTFFNIAYQGDPTNQINISGPTKIYAADAEVININSNNPFQVFSGYPTFTMAYATPDGAESCTFNLVAGPTAALNYKNGTPPTCPDLTISTIRLEDPSFPHDYIVIIKNNGLKKTH